MLDGVGTFKEGHHEQPLAKDFRMLFFNNAHMFFDSSTRRISPRFDKNKVHVNNLYLYTASYYPPDTSRNIMASQPTPNVLTPPEIQ